MKTREHRDKHPRGNPAEEIRREAYRLWQLDGCPPGRELDHWLAAQEYVRHHRHVPHPTPDDAREPEVRATERLVTPT